MQKPSTIMLACCLFTGTSAAIAPDQLSQTRPESPVATTDSMCHDTDALARSLHIQRLYWRDQSEAGLDTELLNALGVDVLQPRRLSLVSARRISGECVGHLDAVNSTVFHFDTDITLVLNNEGILVPHTRPYRPRFIITPDEAHPERARHHFVKAIEAGTGLIEYKDRATHFIGEWNKNGTSILSPYRKNTSGRFRIHRDLLAFKNNILFIGFLPHLNTPSGTIQIILQDGDDRILFSFIWLIHDDGKHTLERIAQSQRFANDIARAIANYGNLEMPSETQANEIYGYSPGDAKLFVVPNNDSDSDSSNGHDNESERDNTNQARRK